MRDGVRTYSVENLPLVAAVLLVNKVMGGPNIDELAQVRTLPSTQKPRLLCIPDPCASRRLHQCSRRGMLNGGLTVLRLHVLVRTRVWRARSTS